MSAHDAASPSGASTATVVAVMALLAVLDLIGAVLAKEWTRGRSGVWFVVGMASFMLLFAVYAIGLRYAELSLVTLGWIVFLQVGVLLVERLHYGVSLPPGKWAAIGAILLLQGYLVLAPNVPDGNEDAGKPAVVETMRYG